MDTLRTEQAAALVAAGAALPAPDRIEPMIAPAGAARALAWSASGEFLAVGHDDGGVQIWDAAAGHPIRTLTGRRAAVTCVAFSPDGLTLAAGGDDGGLALWDAASGHLLATFEGHEGAIPCAAFSPDGAVLAAASDRRLLLWDVRGRYVRRELLGHVSPIVCAAFDRSGALLASGSRDGAVRLWVCAAGRALQTFDQGKVPRYLGFSRDGGTMAALSDSVMRMWEVATGRELRACRTDAGVEIGPLCLKCGAPATPADRFCALCASPLGPGYPRALAIGPDSTTFAVSQDHAPVRVVQAATGRVLHQFPEVFDWIQAVFSPDGAQLAALPRHADVRLWQLTTGYPPRMLVSRPRHDINRIIFSQDGTMLATLCDDIARVWALEEGLELCRSDWTRCPRCGAPTARTDTSCAICATPFGEALGAHDVVFRVGEGGTEMVVVAREGTLRAIHVTTSCELWRLPGNAVATRYTTLSPDGAMLVSLEQDGLVLRNVAAGSTRRIPIDAAFSHIEALAFSDDARTLAVISETGAALLWNVEAEKVLGKLPSADACPRCGVAALWYSCMRCKLEFKPRGLACTATTLAFGLDGGFMCLLNVRSMPARSVVQHGTGPVLSLAFSPEGGLLASGSEDGTVQFLDVADGRVVRRLAGHTGGVLSVAFSPDGALLASGSADGTIRLWSVEDGGHLATFLPTPDGTAAFTPDGRYRLQGDIGSRLWHTVGLCRFELGELDPFLPAPLRVPDGERLFEAPRRAGPA